MTNSNSVTTTGICLYGLPAREEAVVKRVISFSGTQGRNFTLSAMAGADLLIVSDETVVDFADMNPAGCMIIRIADPATTQAYDVLMQRPLLVTKVMRTLDEANALLKASQQEVSAAEPVSVSVEPAVQISEQPNESVQTPEATTQETPRTGVPRSPKPTTSLYAQIMGNAKVAEATTVPTTVPAAVTQITQPVEQDEAPHSEVLQSAAEEPRVSDEPKQDSLQQDAHEEDSESHSLEQDERDQQDQSLQDATKQAVAEHAIAEEKPAIASSNQVAADSESVVSTEKSPDESGEAVKPPATVDQPAYHHLALVVDDSLAIRKQLELELRDAGIGADFAETGEEALEKVANNRYDLVFLDIIMPGIDGYEACRQMRVRSDMKKTPIIMLSAKTSPLDEVQGVIAGASTYLTKPVKSEQLQKTLKRVSMWLDNFQVTA